MKNFSGMERKMMQLQDSLYSESLLQYLDFSKPFLVTTDVSDYAIEEILNQGTIGSPRCIYFPPNYQSWTKLIKKNYAR